MGDRLKNKVAIVTGGASGIGRSTVLRFAQEGAKVMVADRNQNGLEQTVQMAKEINQHVEGLVVDVSKPSQVSLMVERTVDHYGHLHILVNAAAVLILSPSLMEIDERDWDLMMATNLKGLFFCCREAIPAMIRSGSGSIVNISSMAGVQSYTNSLPYALTKAGVIHMTSIVASKYTPQGIRVNCIAPGSVDTAQLRGSTQSKEAFEALVSRNLSGRIGQPEELANAVLFLASDESSYISGATLVVDGGMATVAPW